MSLLFVQVHELERNCRTLETEAQNLRVQTQELEEELSEAENSRLRLEVTLQALKAQFEREISSAEEKGEEKRRALSKQVERESQVPFFNGFYTSCSLAFNVLSNARCGSWRSSWRKRGVSALRPCHPENSWMQNCRNQRRSWKQPAVEKKRP